MKTFDVQLGNRSYPIYIGSELLKHSDLVSKHISGRHVLIISNDKVAPLYIENVLQACANFKCDRFILPDGRYWIITVIAIQP